MTWICCFSERKWLRFSLHLPRNPSPAFLTIPYSLLQGKNVLLFFKFVFFDFLVSVELVLLVAVLLVIELFVMDFFVMPLLVLPCSGRRQSWAHVPEMLFASSRPCAFIKWRHFSCLRAGFPKINLHIPVFASPPIACVVLLCAVFASLVFEPSLLGLPIN